MCLLHHLATSWHKVGPKFAQVAPKLGLKVRYKLEAQVGDQLFESCAKTQCLFYSVLEHREGNRNLSYQMNGKHAITEQCVLV